MIMVSTGTRSLKNAKDVQQFLTVTVDREQS